MFIEDVRIKRMIWIGWIIFVVVVSIFLYSPQTEKIEKNCIIDEKGSYKLCTNESVETKYYIDVRVEDDSVINGSINISKDLYEILQEDDVIKCVLTYEYGTLDKIELAEGLDKNSNQYDCQSCFDAVYAD